MSIIITWLGHSALALDINGTQALIDPFLKDNPLGAADADTIPASYILLSHGHRDHVGDTLDIAQRTGAMVIANNEVANWCGRQGAPHIHGMNPDGAYNFGFARVALTIAFHSSSLPDGTYGGQPNGILIHTPDGFNLYHAGDTGLFSDMALIGRKGLDFAALPIGGNYTMGPEEALEAVKLLKPRVVLPIHYNTFPVIQTDAAAWAQAVHNETDSKVIVLDPGDSYELLKD